MKGYEGTTENTERNLILYALKKKIKNTRNIFNINDLQGIFKNQLFKAFWL